MFVRPRQWPIWKQCLCTASHIYARRAVLAHGNGHRPAAEVAFHLADRALVQVQDHRTTAIIFLVPVAIEQFIHQRRDTALLGANVGVERVHHRDSTKASSAWEYSRDASCSGMWRSGKKQFSPSRSLP